MEYNYPYHVEDAGEPKPEPEKPKKKRGFRWWILIVVLLVGGAVAAQVYFGPRISFRPTPYGFTFSIGEPKELAPTETEKLPPITKPAGADAPTLMIAPSPAGAETPSSTQAGALSLQDIYAKVLPSVVTITVDTRSGRGLGTGVVFSEDGYIVTNQHVVSGAAAIQVQLSDNRIFDAAEVGSDEISDLAVLKIEADGLTPAEFGNSDALRVGDSVCAIGSPLGIGLRGTLTDGIVSGINRDMQVSGRTMTLLQTNAALNSGNSGGPLINCYGQVVGINTIKLGSSYYFSSASVEGLGFAIPMATAKPIVDELVEKGYVSGRPALGVQAETLPLRTQFYYSLPEGAYLTYVDPDSDAAAQGLRAGDIITAIDGTAVTGEESLSAVLAGYAAGDTVTVTIYRSRATYDVRVTLGDRFAQD